MPKLTETFARRLPAAKSGTEKYWDSEVKGLVLFVGKRSNSWYYQKNVGGHPRGQVRHPLNTPVVPAVPG